MAKSVLGEIASKCGCNKLAPKAQLKPIVNKGIWATDIKKASAVWPRLAESGLSSDVVSRATYAVKTIYRVHRF